MNKALSLILRDVLLVNNNYVDVSSGLIQVVKFAIDSEQGLTMVKNLPFSTLATAEDRQFTDRAMVPDSSQKCMFYFEDGAIRQTGESMRGPDFSSSMRLVCWVNGGAIDGGEDKLLATKIQGDFINRIHAVRNLNLSPFVKLTAQVANIPPAGPGLFPYDYDEEATQYLLHPYDCFALDLDITFNLARGCGQEVTIKPPEC